MSRRKFKPLLPWCTPTADGRAKSFSIIDNAITKNKAFISLSSSAKVMYFIMVTNCGGRREFTMPKSIYTQYMAIDTFQNVKKELIEKGFIREKKNGANLREKNIYEFCFDWKNNDQPPQH